MSSGILRLSRQSSGRQLGELSAARLLGGISCKIDRETGISATIIWDTGERQHFESIRLLDLTKKCWDDEAPEVLELLCRRLRFLHDTSKKDFLLRSSGDMIFVRSDFVRAVVEPKRAIFLGVPSTATFDQFLTELEAELDSELAKEFSMSCARMARKPFNNRLFGIWVLDCIICANVTLHNLRLQVLAPVAQSILDNIRLDRCEDAILQLYPVKMALSTFIEQVRPLVHCLLNGGEEERESRGRKGCSNAHGPSSWCASSFMQTRKTESYVQGDPIKSLRIDDHETFHIDSGTVRGRPRSEEDMMAAFPMELRPGSLEEVLDNWIHNAEEMMADATELSGSMDDAIRFLEASMSCMRNRLLQLELGTDVTALVFALGALVSGIFGMNLHTGIEDTPGYFVPVCLFILGCGLLIVGFAMWVIRRSKRHYQNHSARFGNNKFFKSFNDDGYILRDLGTRITESGTLPPDVLLRVLQDLQEPFLPVRDSGLSRRLRAREESSSHSANDIGPGIILPRRTSRNINGNGSNTCLLHGSAS